MLYPIPYPIALKAYQLYLQFKAREERILRDELEAEGEHDLSAQVQLDLDLTIKYADEVKVSVRT